MDDLLGFLTTKRPRAFASVARRSATASRIPVFCIALFAMTLTLEGCGGGSVGQDQSSAAQTAAPTAVAGDTVSKSVSSKTSSVEADKAGTTRTDAQVPTNPVAAPASSIVPPGRLLASNCFQCHGTNGVPSGGFDRLAGTSAREIAGEMREMAGKPDKGIMHVQALGFTDAQVTLLATYFASQR